MQENDERRCEPIVVALPADGSLATLPALLSHGGDELKISRITGSE